MKNRQFWQFWAGTMLLAAMVWGAGSAGAQDRFSIPGVDDAAVAGGAGGEAVVVKQYGNLLEKVLDQGGWAIWPLVGLSVLLVGLSVFCLIDLTRRNFVPGPLLGLLQESVDRVELATALELAGKSPTCLGQVMYGAVEYIGDRGFQTLDDNGLYDAMADVSQEFNRGRARTINMFSVIAQSAPMIGLLGTVSGMIKAFDKLGQTGMGDPAQLAANISEALWTTAAGLVVAVPALYLYFYFRDRLTSLVGQTDRHAYRLLNRLRRVVVARTMGPRTEPLGALQKEAAASFAPGGGGGGFPSPLPQPLPQPE